MIPSWSIGVILSLIGCSMSNIGINIQKLGHTGTEDGKSVLASPMWIFGLILVALGSIIDFVSFGFADMSLLAPLGAMTLGKRVSRTMTRLCVLHCFLNLLWGGRTVCTHTHRSNTHVYTHHMSALASLSRSRLSLCTYVCHTRFLDDDSLACAWPAFQVLRTHTLSLSHTRCHIPVSTASYTLLHTLQHVHAHVHANTPCSGEHGDGSLLQRREAHAQGRV